MARLHNHRAIAKMRLREKVEIRCDVTPMPEGLRCKPQVSEEPEQMLPEERRSSACFR